VIQLKTTGEWKGITGPPYPGFFRHGMSFCNSIAYPYWSCLGSGGQEGRVTLNFPEDRVEEYQALLDWLKDKVKEHSALECVASSTQSFPR
jgi:hypothetical protein